MRDRRRTNSPPPLPPGQVRSRLIGDVEQMWIEGVLQRSSYQDLLQALARPEQVKALPAPWRFHLQEDDAPSTLLAADTSISELYGQFAGSLLLLGEPGAGKTTLLLTLARELLNRARSDDRQPIPVVLNLSTWRTQRRTLDSWLFSELSARYGIERHHARPWLRADLLVLLLDGLDELIEEERASCIEAINLYYLEHPGVHLVVCCREDAYLSQSVRLALHTTAQLQPLSPQQVEAYFEAVGEPSIQKARQVDTNGQTLIQTPLILTLTLLVHHADPTHKFPIVENIQEQREQILAAYLEYRLKGDQHYPEEQVWRWLAWLAGQMQGHDLSLFYLEDMQPDWLPAMAARRMLVALFGVIAGLPFVPLVALLVKGSNGPGIGVLAGLLVGLLFALYAWFRDEIKPVDNILTILRGLRRNILVWVLGGLLAGVLGISVGGLPYGVPILLLYALAVWVVVGPDDQGQQGRPGGRIWRAGQNGLAIGLLAALGFGLLGVPFAALYIGLIIGMVAGLVAGGSAFIRHFLLRFLLSRSSRSVKVRGEVPHDLPAFLSYAVEHALLYRVGAGYLFPHHSLRDHCATWTRPSQPLQRDDGSKSA